MHSKNMIGLVVGAICLIIGAYCLVTGYRYEEKTVAKIKNKITGTYPAAKRNHIISGVGFVVVGCGLIYFFRPRKKKH